MPDKTVEIVEPGLLRKQSLTASVSKSCVFCGAPAVFQRSELFIKKYPKIFRPAWAGRPVGDTCPCCGVKRPKDESLGEIWTKEWRVPTLSDYYRRVRDWLLMRRK
jgi:hypothetical protein